MFIMSFTPKSLAGLLARGAAMVGLVLVALAPTANTAEGRARISTGQDLYEACKVLNEFVLKPDGPTPRLGLYCQQYISGYFTSLRVMQDGDGAQSVTGPPIHAADCIGFDGPRTYGQLAGKIVRSGEWHPELMTAPAYKLAQQAFDAMPPCPQ
jgi:hypothetical protein